MGSSVSLSITSMRSASSRNISGATISATGWWCPPTWEMPRVPQPSPKDWECLWQRAPRNGGSILELLRHLREHEARSIRIACTHGIFSNTATQRLAAEPDILEIVCTNTVPIPAEKRVPKLTVLSIAPALAEAMRRINSGESVSALFHSEPTTRDDERTARRA